MTKESQVFELPSGRALRCTTLAGIEDAVQEMADYFRHGIDVRPGDTVFDVGANVGIFSLTVFDRCAGDVDLYAFEPVPRLHELLERNVSSCDSSRLRSFAHGLGESEQEICFAYYPRMPVWSSARTSKTERVTDRARYKRALARSIADGRTGRWLQRVPRIVRAGLVDLLVRRASKVEQIRCRLRTCSDIIRDEQLSRIDLLKIDVEGAELGVLHGIEDAHWACIRQIVLEVHGGDATRDALRAVLEPRGFSLAYEQDAVQREAELGLLYARREAR